MKLVNQADIVVTHNGDKFDLPKINSRFIVNGLLLQNPTLVWTLVEWHRDNLALVQIN